MSSLQKTGGMAALIHAVVYVVGLVLGFILIFPILDATPRQYMAFVADNQAIVYIWNLITYWGSAITVIVMALALYERLKSGSPALAQTATVFGFIWAALIIGSGNLMLKDVGVVADLHSEDPAQAATVWAALQAVENGIVSGNELVGSLWVSLLSLAALRTGGLTRVLNYLGVALGVVGIITLIFFDAVFVFGLGMIVWSVWVGIVMLRRSPVSAAVVVGQTAEQVAVSLVIQAVQVGLPVMLLDGRGTAAVKLSRLLLREIAAGRMLFLAVMPLDFHF